MKASELIKIIEKECEKNGFETSDLEVCVIDENGYINTRFKVEYDGDDVPSIYIINRKVREPKCSCDICKFSSIHDYVPNHYYCNKGCFFNDREPISNCEKGEIVGWMYEEKYGEPFNK